MPPKARDFLAADDSGINQKPCQKSTVKPEHRIDFLTHSSLARFLSGPGLKPLAARFQDNLSRNLVRLEIGNEWMELPDLYEFIRVQLFNASAEAMFGPYILTLNPTLCKDFWRFDKDLGYLTKGYPHWMNPTAYRARAKCLAAVKKWHGFVREYCESTESGPDNGFDPKFGAEIMRYRQKMWSKMDAMDVDARASEDLGFLWGANANSSRTAFWLIYETFRSHTLLQRVRDAMRVMPHSGLPLASASPPPINTSHTPSPFDASFLSSDPLIQSLYAETLRLRAATLVLRSTKDDGVTLGNWVMPQGNIMVMSTYHAHRDQDTWNIGTAEEPHPLDEFWAERFLVHSSKTSSGPLKPRSADKNDVTSTTVPDLSTLPSSPTVPAAKLNDNSNGSAYFSTEGLAGAWIPYGGGQNMCPGRHFAKQEILCIFAFMVTSFDIHLIDPSPPRVDWGGFGTGILAPAGKGIRCRIRRRGRLG